jgi:hypothetical protein
MEIKMKKNEKNLLKHCKTVIDDSVADAGGVFDFVNKFVVVPDEESTIRDMADAMSAAYGINEALQDESYYCEVRRVYIEVDGKLTVHLFVNYEWDKHGEIIYKNNQCTVTWDSDKQLQPQSVMSFYQIPENTLNELSYQDVWYKYVASKVSGVSCRNIFHCMHDPMQIGMAMSAGLDKKGWLYKDIENEKASGANYVFIQPVNGAPVGGYEIDELLHATVSQATQTVIQETPLNGVELKDA